MEFYDGGTFPSQYNGALFFSDYSRSCIWVMFPDANGVPTRPPASRSSTDAGGPVDLQVGPAGDLFYADANTGTIQRIHAISSNHAPDRPRERDAHQRRHPASRELQRHHLDGSRRRHRSPTPGTSTATAPTTTRPRRSPASTTRTSGTRTVRLRVTDPGGLSGTDSLTITAGTPAHRHDRHAHRGHHLAGRTT